MPRLSLSNYSIFVKIVVAIGILCLFWWSLAQAQHNHSAGHDEYKDWVSRDGASCCHDRDCGSLKVDEERTTNGKHEIKVEGKWCPVLPGMYLKQGKSPDWSVSHACVWPNHAGNEDVCSRLRCYQGPGGV